MIIKLLLTLAFSVAALFAVRLIFTSRLLRGFFLLFISITATFFVNQPELATTVANALGVGRGADLVMYSFISVFALGMLMVSSHISKLYFQITQLTRTVAILNAKKMTDSTKILISALCVLGLTAGNLLFKLTANEWKIGGTIFNSRTLTYLFVSLTVYACATFCYIWLLQGQELSAVYPVLALTYLLVPLGAYLLFGETLSWSQILGFALILTGVVLATR